MADSRPQKPSDNSTERGSISIKGRGADYNAPRRNSVNLPFKKHAERAAADSSRPPKAPRLLENPKHSPPPPASQPPLPPPPPPPPPSNVQPPRHPRNLLDPDFDDSHPGKRELLPSKGPDLLSRMRGFSNISGRTFDLSSGSAVNKDTFRTSNDANHWKSVNNSYRKEPSTSTRQQPQNYKDDDEKEEGQISPMDVKSKDRNEKETSEVLLNEKSDGKRDAEPRQEPQESYRDEERRERNDRHLDEERRGRYDRHPHEERRGRHDRHRDEEQREKNYLHLYEERRERYDRNRDEELRPNEGKDQNHQSSAASTRIKDVNIQERRLNEETNQWSSQETYVDNNHNWTEHEMEEKKGEYNRNRTETVTEVREEDESQRPHRNFHGKVGRRSLASSANSTPVSSSRMGLHPKPVSSVTAAAENSTNDDTWEGESTSRANRSDIWGDAWADEPMSHTDDWKEYRPDYQNREKDFSKQRISNVKELVDGGSSSAGGNVKGEDLSTRHKHHAQHHNHQHQHHRDRTQQSSSQQHRPRNYPFLVPPSNPAIPHSCDEILFSLKHLSEYNSRPRPPPCIPLSGRFIGSSIKTDVYDLENKLGEGTFGVVYKAKVRYGPLDLNLFENDQIATNGKKNENDSINDHSSSQTSVAAIEENKFPSSSQDNNSREDMPASSQTQPRSSQDDKVREAEKDNNKSKEEEQSNHNENHKNSSKYNEKDTKKGQLSKDQHVVVAGNRRYIKAGDAVALKRIILHSEMDGLPITALREIRLLKNLRHENVVSVVDIAYDSGDIVSAKRGETFMVFPYMDHDLAGLLNNRHVNLTMEICKLYAMQLLEGTFYLHMNLILHRDIKAANLLIDHRGVLQIADFGLARSLANEKGVSYTDNVVTRWYRSPELLLRDRKYGTAVDMWGIGCIIGEMFKRHPIFQGNSDMDQISVIFECCGDPNDGSMPGWQKLPGPDGNYMALTFPTRRRKVREEYEVYDPNVADLLDKLLVLDPNKRLSAREALDHDWFWTDPLPAKIGTLVKFQPSHEYDRQKRDEQNIAARKQQLKRQQQQQQQLHLQQQQQQQQFQQQLHLQQQQGFHPPNQMYGAPPLHMPGQGGMPNNAMFGSGDRGGPHLHHHHHRPNNAAGGWAGGPRGGPRDRPPRLPPAAGAEVGIGGPGRIDRSAYVGPDGRKRPRDDGPADEAHNTMRRQIPKQDELNYG